MLGVASGSIYYQVQVLVQVGALDVPNPQASLARSEVRIAPQLGRAAAIALSTATPRFCAGMVDETRRRIVLALIQHQQHGSGAMRTVDLARAVGRRIEPTYRSALWLAGVGVVVVDSGSVATQIREGIVCTTPWFDQLYSTLADRGGHESREAEPARTGPQPKTHPDELRDDRLV